MTGKRRRHWYQYSLRTLLLLTALLAAALSGVTWWQSTRKQRALQRAIRECPILLEVEKDLLCSLIWQREGGQLLEQLVWAPSSQVGERRRPFLLRCRLDWHTRFLDVQSRPRRVFLFHRFYGDWGTIVLTDDRYRLIQWKEVRAEDGLVFTGVETSSGAVELSVAVRVHSHDEARGAYRFLLDDNGIIEHGFERDEAYARLLREKSMEQMRADKVGHEHLKAETSTP